jgi:myo-inositol-1(or 4)-monophosphatase
MLPTLAFTENLARQAGAILRAGYGQQHHIHHKGIIDLVTEVDHQSDAAIIAGIRQEFPDHCIITEESGSLVGNNDHCWYIDPLDGTLNYAHAVPFFCVSIAYVEYGALKLAVVYEPMRDECYSAEKGQGAWLNGQPIHAADSSKLIDSLLVTGFPYDLLGSAMHNIDYFGYFSRRSQGVRRLGSAALDLCYVAAGRLDGYWELSINNWDIAAGALIAREAGAVVSKVDGDTNLFAAPISILAANPTLYPQILAVLQKDVSEVK